MMILELEQVDVSEMIRSIYVMTHVQAEQKRLFLNTNLPDEDLRIPADFQKLQQVLLNIVGNSIKFTREGGIDIEVQRKCDDQVVIEVRDTGVGVALDKQEMIFDKFAQADGSTSREFGGTGLGLSITRSMVELMDGTITLFSEGIGRGTTLTLTFSLYDEFHAEALEPESWSGTKSTGGQPALPTGIPAGSK